MAEKEFISGTQVVAFFRLPLAFHKTVFRTLAVAHGKHLARSAGLRQGGALGCAEGNEPFTGEDLGKSGLPDVSYSPGWQDKMIADIDIAIVFNYRDVAAGRPEEAQ